MPNRANYSLRWDPRQPQGCVSIAEAEGLVGPSTYGDPAASSTGPQESPPSEATSGGPWITHVPCGADGWGHLTEVIDCHDREGTGYEFALRGRAKEAERALEEACLAGFGTLRPNGATPVVRSDNELIFESRRFRAACRDYRLHQEFITRYTAEQKRNRRAVFRSLKEECESGPTRRSANSPREFRGLQPKLVA